MYSRAMIGFLTCLELGRMEASVRVRCSSYSSRSGQHFPSGRGEEEDQVQQVPFVFPGRILKHG